MLKFYYYYYYYFTSFKKKKRFASFPKTRENKSLIKKKTEMENEIELTNIEM